MKENEKDNKRRRRRRSKRTKMKVNFTGGKRIQYRIRGSLSVLLTVHHSTSVE
jgi:hypothetical protein